MQEQQLKLPLDFYRCKRVSGTATKRRARRNFGKTPTQFKLMLPIKMRATHWEHIHSQAKSPLQGQWAAFAQGDAVNSASKDSVKSSALNFVRKVISKAMHKAARKLCKFVYFNVTGSDKNERC